MTEILFSGKRVDNGEWAIGQYYKRTHYYGDLSVKHYIITSTEDLSYDQALEYHEIDPETIGQFINRKDREGKPIFEGDIVQNKFGQAYAVRMDPGRCGWYPFACGDGCGCCEEETEDPRSCIVIGNIHDNPELLEVKKEWAR